MTYSGYGTIPLAFALHFTFFLTPWNGKLLFAILFVFHGTSSLTPDLLVKSLLLRMHISWMLVCLLFCAGNS